jgi:hypothetical protein
MLNVIQSEAIRISQRRTLLIWFGLMAGFAVMVNTVMGSALSASTGGLPTPGVSLPTREELETSSGIVAGLWSPSHSGRSSLHRTIRAASFVSSLLQNQTGCDYSQVRRSPSQASQRSL